MSTTGLKLFGNKNDINQNDDDKFRQLDVDEFRIEHHNIVEKKNISKNSKVTTVSKTTWGEETKFESLEKINESQNKMEKAINRWNTPLVQTKKPKVVRKQEKLESKEKTKFIGKLVIKNDLKAPSQDDLDFLKKQKEKLGLLNPVKKEPVIEPKPKEVQKQVDTIQVTNPEDKKIIKETDNRGKTLLKKW